MRRMFQATTLYRLAALTFVLLVIGTASSIAQAPPEGRGPASAITLFELADGGSAAFRAAGGPAAVGDRSIELSPRAVAGRADTRVLYFPLPGGEALEAHREFGENREYGDFLWSGSIQGRRGQAILTMKNGRMSGLIRAGRKTYQIIPGAAHDHLLVEMDPSLFPECGGGVAPEESFFSDEYGVPDAEVSAAEGIVIIDVLAVYTPQARDAVGGVSNVEAMIQNAVDVANTAFRDSASTARLRLVHTALVEHDDSGDLSSDLNWVKNDSEVASLRDQHYADLVGLIVEDGGGFCGLGYVMRSPEAAFAPMAFQVTVLGCAVGNLSYAHEHGHNLGLDHNPENGDDPSQASFPWSFGHYVDGVFRTVMSYSDPCPSGCGRVPQFSNPNVTYGGFATGIAGERDNRRTLDEGGTAAIAAAFREGSSDDYYEENDSLDAAYDLSINESVRLSLLHGLGVQSDDDWYRVSVLPGNEKVILDLRFKHSEGDIDLALHDASGSVLAQSISVTDNERISYMVPSAGIYYVRVYFANAGNAYDLAFDSGVIFSDGFESGDTSAW